MTGVAPLPYWSCCGVNPAFLIAFHKTSPYCWEFSISGKLVGSCTPTFTFTSTVGFPSLPCFVVIKITPLAAWEP